MRVERQADAATFLARAGSFLLADEVVNGLAYSIASRVRNGVSFGEGAPLFVTVSEADDVVLAALRTPPYNLVVSNGSESAAEALAGELADRGESLPGVTGPQAPATAFARAFAAPRGGQSFEVRMAEELYTIRSVVPARPGAGDARRAGEHDRAQLMKWFQDFDEEAVGDGIDPTPVVDRHLAAGSAFVYEDGGALVSMLVAVRATERSLRIGGVFTPRNLRQRGYASRLVAAITQKLLDEGADYISLFTDLSNPTSNGIYRALGYTPAARFTMIEFK